MDDVSTDRPPISDRSGVTDAVRTQILATEHWSLLSTRSMLWNEAFSRASMYLTVLSASVVALALVAQATDFGRGFRIFALLVLPVVLFLGWATYERVAMSSTEDLWLVVGMNRLRHAYLELAPELEPYFVTAHHDDEASVLRSISFVDRRGDVSPTRVVVSASLLVGIMSAVVAGVFAALIVDSLGGATVIVIAMGLLVGLIYAGITFLTHIRGAFTFRRDNKPRFPAPGSPDP
jgi:hypothetical protein